MEKIEINQKKQLIKSIIGRMSLEQKVGQCFTVLWSGHMITPSVVEAIEKLHIGNLRIQPHAVSGKRTRYYGFNTAGDGYDYPEGYKPIAESWFTQGRVAYISPEDYAEVINKLQQIAVNRPCGIPLNIATDQEGDFSRDYHYGGINMFPPPMGLVAGGDMQLVYEVHKANALQQSAMGVTCIHSPVLDVNINPGNPEIGVRSFSDDPVKAAEYAIAAMRGLQDGGLITTAKHFPGRGDSKVDAHHDVPVLDADRKRMEEVELYPFRKLIENGLDCVMIAHNIYPALDPSGLIATVSPTIINDVLRGELGFKGVITTDAIAMGGLMKLYGLPEACAKALQAGVDLVLNKTETEYRDQGVLETLKYVREGKITEEELDKKVYRILSMKYDRGLFKTGGRVDASKASEPMKKKEIIDLSRTAARKAAMVLRDRDSLLPLTKDKKLMVIEQVVNDEDISEDTYFHRLTFNEAMLRHTSNILGLDTRFVASEEDENVVMSLLDRVDVVVATNLYARTEGSNSTLLKKVADAGKKLVLVVNSPYEFSVLPEASTVVCTFSSTPDSLKLAADILFGTDKAEGSWPLVRYSIDNVK